MSFIKNREKLFRSRSQRRSPLKRPKGIRMRSASAFDDPRAWSLDPRKRTAFMIESVNELPSSSGEDVNKETSQSEMDEEEYVVSKKICCAKDSKSFDNVKVEDDFDSIKIKNHLITANEIIVELQKINGDLLREKSETESEVANLRNLVFNMKEHMEYLKNPCPDKKSNENDDRETALERAQQEIAHLSKQIEIYTEMRAKFPELRRIQEKLTDEKHELSKTVNDLKFEKRQLLDKLKTKEDDFISLETRVKFLDEGVKEKTILRERLTAKEEKISSLTEILEKQNTTVEQLNLELCSVKNLYETKERSLNREIVELQKQLKEKTALISTLEAKLHQTELLVAELETVRDQFRSNNLVLTETIRTFRKELDEMVSKSESLTMVMKQLRKENEAKDEEIRKLTLFPHNPDTVIYFAHMNKLVTAAPEKMTADQQTELLDNLKTTIVKLKNEMWGTNATPLEFQIQDSESQTEFGKKEQVTQCSPRMYSTIVQTLVSDEYVEMFRASENEIARLNSRIIDFEKHLSDQAVELDSIETSLFDTIEESHAKELELERVKSVNDLMQDSLHSLRAEFESTESFLSKALIEVEEQVSASGRMTEEVELTLKKTFCDYLDFATRAEAFIEQKNSHILNLKDIVDRMMAKHEKAVREMGSEVGELKMQLQNEKQSSFELNVEVNRLHEVLSEKSKIIHGMEVEKSDDNAEDVKSQLFVYKREMLRQLRDYKLLEDELEKVKYSRKALKKFLKSNLSLRKESQMKLKKICRHLNRYRSRQARSAEQIETLKKSAADASAENCMLKQERSVLLQELYSLKEKLKDGEKLVKRHEEKRVAHEELKMKMEKIVLKLMKRVAKYKNALMARLDCRKEECAVISEKLSCEIDLLKEENMSLSTTICSLKQKLSSILELPQKDDANESFVKPEKAEVEKETLYIENFKSHYENVIETLKKEYETKTDLVQKQYIDNLRMAKDAYDRETASLKISQSQQFENYKLELAEEMKIASEKENEMKLERIRAELDEKFAREVAILTATLQRSLEENESKFEIEKLQTEKELMAVEMKVIELRRESTEAIQRLKSDCDIRIVELEECQRNILDDIDRRVDLEVDIRLSEKQLKMESKTSQCLGRDLKESATDTSDEIQKTESSCNTDVSSFVCQKITDINLLERISCEIKDESSKAIMSLVPSISDGSPSVSERDFWLSRIIELENNQRSLQRDFAQKLKLYERKYKHEQLKAKELSHILEQELMYSTDVHCKLGLQYNRAEQLELEKESLSSQLTIAEQQLAFLRETMANEKYTNVTAHFDDYAPEKSRELEKSINRLKKKIEKAEILERKLTCKFDSDSANVDDYPIKEPPAAEEIPKNESNSTDVKLVFYQKKFITESWSSHEFEEL